MKKGKREKREEESRQKMERTFVLSSGQRVCKVAKLQCGPVHWAPGTLASNADTNTHSRARSRFLNGGNGRQFGSVSIAPAPKLRPNERWALVEKGRRTKE